MLSFKDKIKIFQNLLEQKEISYADSFNAWILLYSSNCDFLFLKKLKTKQEIENWIDRLKSRIVSREEDDLIENIMDDYIISG